MTLGESHFGRRIRYHIPFGRWYPRQFGPAIHGRQAQEPQIGDVDRL